MEHLPIGYTFNTQEGEATVIGEPTYRKDVGIDLCGDFSIRYIDIEYWDYPCRLIPYNGNRSRKTTYALTPSFVSVSLRLLN